jgi:hypothetical protein
LIFILAGLWCSGSLYAQDRAETNGLSPGQAIVAAEKVPLRASAPQEGLFYSLGKHLGPIEKGEELNIAEVKKVKTLFSNQVWVQVERDPTKLKGGEPASGWVYVGDGGEKSCCFTIKK